MVTMKQVAELAGVSITTVSHVLNETRKVAPDTRERVLAAIESTGYTGDAIARSLVTGGTRSLGVAISVVTNPYFAELLAAIESQATAAGYTLLLMDTHDDTEIERTAVRALRSRRVDGLLLTPSSAARSSVLPELIRLGMPTVLVDRLPAGRALDQVGPENVQSTSKLVEHLAGHGHTRIGMVSGAEELTTSQERVLGYRLGLGRAGLAWDPALVISGNSSNLGARDALRQLRILDPPPTALITGNNVMTAGVLHAARAEGVRIGEDLAIAAYDDMDWAELVDPPLTTMAQPVDQIGRAAVDMLVRRLADPQREPETVRFPAEFRGRKSCGC
ncbi:LacI family DNA-binding transcriptional regulator [Sciscionella marina]|uniref:LacI family DNA-binding transcriptional regulator n=1 Tax=Sciscionella marina TaxID=508770 RepID=UPI0003728C96|nr:LacI family DNA-binding transcriptional regulator [Sciscionella marina]